MAWTRTRKRFLPHWETERGVYFVTFRLADSLPRSVLDEIRQSLADSRTAEATIAEQPTAGMAVLQGNRQPQRLLEEYLDRGAGACYLNRPEIAEAAAQTLRHFDGRRYRLLAWCTMPNHVHVIFQPNAPFDLQHVLHSWKSYSALQANRLLKRTGKFWQREHYDHLIRDGEELGRAIRYTAENPLKAGLKDWRSIYVAKDWT